MAGVAVSEGTGGESTGAPLVVSRGDVGDAVGDALPHSGDEDTLRKATEGAGMEASSSTRMVGKNKLFSVCIFILVVEMCEQFCYYTLQGSQRNFLEDAGPIQANGERGMAASVAISISSCWSMLCYLSCIVGGYVADNRIGRYRTILYFALVYVVGVVLVACAAIPRVMESSACLPLYLCGALVFVSLGTGAIKPNVMNFGAAQYDATDPTERAQQKTFFSYFYLTINLGVVGAFGYTTNLATSRATADSPGSGFLYAYLIAAIAMGTAFLVYLSGTPKYTARGGVTHTPVVSVIRRHIAEAARTTLRGKVAALGWCLLPAAMVVVFVGSLLGDQFPSVSHALTWTGIGLTVIGCAALTAAHLKNGYIGGAVDDREAASGAAQVAEGGVSLEDVRGALACVPTIICVNVGFNIPYNAGDNAYPTMACQMDTRVFGGEQLNGAFITLGNAFTIILLVPLFENFLFPWLERCRGGRPVTRWAKYNAGFAFVIAANLVAALIERARRDMSVGADPRFVACPPEDVGSEACSGDGKYLLSKCSPNASLRMTALSFWWTVIPMVLTGIGEILVNPTIYQFVFEQAPPRLSSIVQALNLVAGGAVSNAITAALGPLVPENLNDGHLVAYFYTNIGFAVVLLVVYWYVAAHGEVPAEAAGPAEAPAEAVNVETTRPSLATSFLAAEHRASASLLGSRHSDHRRGRSVFTSVAATDGLEATGGTGRLSGAAPPSRDVARSLPGRLRSVPGATVANT